MSEVMEVTTSTPAELLGAGRRHLAVRDYNAAAEALAKACELLAKEYGDTADQCAEAYLWYGKALLGLAREESGVLGDGVPGPGNDDEDDDDNVEDEGENEEGEQNEEPAKENGEVEKVKVESTTKEAEGTTKEAESTTKEAESTSKEAESTSKKAESTSKEAESTSKEAESTSKEAESTSKEAESTSKEEMAGSSTGPTDDAEPSTTNGEANEESAVNLENEDDVDNLQLAWEMLDLSRSILSRRAAVGVGVGAGVGAGEGAAGARAQLAEVLLALGEVALESETYDKAVRDMQSCLDLQKELYQSDDRRIAETHYQIGLANCLASNFDDAITHFKNAANILSTRIKILESPSAVTEDATVKKFTSADPFYSVEGEIKELKELLPEIQEKIQDMMDYKAETMKRLRETLLPSNGEGSSSQMNGAGPSTAAASAPAPAPPRAPASDISHLIKRKRKSSEGGDAGPAKRANT